MEIKTDLCADCVYCVSACAFEAITKEEGAKEVKLDKDKCQACGACYSACPSGQIITMHYNLETLTKWMQDKMAEKPEAKTLVMACRGSKPSDEEIEKMAGTKDYIEMTLPCMGRVPIGFYMNFAETGMDAAHLIFCDEEFCRMKKGDELAANKIDTAQMMYEDMGLLADMLVPHRAARRAVIDSEKCIACGNCVFVCPYDAAILELGTAKIDEKKCHGCGICVSECPAKVITLTGSLDEDILSQLPDFETGPKKVAFVCQWSEYLNFDEPKEIEGVKIIPVPCAGRIDVEHLLEAVKRGATDILTVTCTETQCKQEDKGNKRGQQHAAEAYQLLKQLGMKDRIKIKSITPKYMGEFEQALEAFMHPPKEVKK
jgi:ferredoxin